MSAPEVVQHHRRRLRAATLVLGKLRRDSLCAGTAFADSCRSGNPATIDVLLAALDVLVAAVPWDASSEVIAHVQAEADRLALALGADLVTDDD